MENMPRFDGVSFCMFLIYMLFLKCAYDWAPNKCEYFFY